MQHHGRLGYAHQPLERDGALSIDSYLSSIHCLLYYGALIYLGHAGFERLISL
jgi:hypothetical protein